MIAKVKTETVISCAHYLPNYDGKCANLHGHNFRVVVEIEGDIDSKTGMVIDFTKMKKVIDQYDHKSLNDFLSNPTAEELASEIAYTLFNLENHKFKSVVVRVYESYRSYAEVKIVS
mgnify:CR=1 FL=1